MLIKNGKLYYEGQWQNLDVRLSANKIVEIGTNLSGDNEVIDATNQYLLPGLIDMHVHLREPGFEKKETIKTGTQAALRGGFTTVAPMPNLNPVPDTKELMEAYLELINANKECHVYPYAALSKGLKGEELSEIKAISSLGIKLFSDDGKGVQSDELMEEAMRQVKSVDGFLVAHLEDEKYLLPKASLHHNSAKRFGVNEITSEVEYAQLARDLKLVEKTGVKYHACHLSTKESVAYLAKAKAEGLDASGEVCLHHLLLNEDSVVDANWKMNPPLRSEEDRQALIAGIQSGVIEMIVSDHAPHLLSEKAKGMAEAPFGIVGLETNLPLAYSYLVKPGLITLEQLQALMATNPAKRFGLTNKGLIAVGYDADITIVDLNNTSTINAEEFVSLGKNTPFNNYEVNLEVVSTIIDGKVGYQVCKDI